MLYLRDQWASFKFDGRIQNGKIIGITDIGQLILETEQETRIFNTKEIEFIN
jgi:biotin-(acetyl-CoA carboxylase) ligase